jgi:hypothetical protein
MLSSDRVAGAALALLALVVLWDSRGLPLGTLRSPGPAYVPVVLALILLGAGLTLAAVGGAAPPLRGLDWRELRHAVAIFGVCAFAAWALERLGYRLTVAIVLAFLLGVVERRGLLFTALLSIGMAVGSFFVFATLLRVPLPLGPLGF